MGILDTLREKARANVRRIVLAEGTEERTIKAASVIASEGITDVTLLGDENEILAAAKGIDLSKVHILDIKKSGKLEEYAANFYEMRRDKGVTMESALKTMQSTLYYGAMMLKQNEADGMVAGAINTTGDVLRPGLQIIKTEPGIPVVSSCFLMELPDKRWGDDGVMFFADCAVNPKPNAEQLAAIAISTAKTQKVLTGNDARIAMLSFSTYGSASHELVDLVREATEIARKQAPELTIDGEMQADAALVEKVAKLKAPGSPVGGKANVLVFPDLQAGNIGYKLVQRLAGAEAIGPICQGMAKPINDLSRGCSYEDIVNVVAITSLQGGIK